MSSNTRQYLIAVAPTQRSVAWHLLQRARGLLGMVPMPVRYEVYLMQLDGTRHVLWSGEDVQEARATADLFQSDLRGVADLEAWLSGR